MNNMLSHYLIIPTPDTIKLHFCGSITFNGVIVAPSAVRVLSWMIPNSEKRKASHSVRNFLWLICCCRVWYPVDDLAVATVLLMAGGQLVLLRPRKVCIVNYCDAVLL